jgi:hypothetical protein
MRSVEDGGRSLLNKTARRSEQFISISVAALFVGRRSAGRPGLDFASVGQASDSSSGRTWRTVDSADHTCRNHSACHHVSLMVGNIRPPSIGWFGSGKSKRKPFNSNVEDYLIFVATFASYPLVLNDPSNICMSALPLSYLGVRFNASAMFLAPAFCFARDFS